jgi:lycopene beta-cyclase
LGAASVLIIDRAAKDANDRTWCYWTKDGHPFPELVHHTWPQLSFRDYRGEVASKMGQYEYGMVRSADFYRHIKTQLRENPNIHFLRANVEKTISLPDGAKVFAGGQWYRAGKVLNSIFDPAKIRPRENEYLLYQHFKGWWIETDTPAFDPQKATLMDFRTPQRGDGRFFYVLPFSEKEALVEFTIFSQKLLDQKDYDFYLRKYIGEKLGLRNYTVQEEEFGVIPMTNASFPRHSSPNIVNIGTPAGAVKPTTGYAFLNIVRNSKAWAQELVDGGVSPARREPASRFQFYDHL